ncbi:hypothetical protein OS493_023927 [Desmophyllum pertusum]|uniref:G-protein coupled receptors family 1 profile domain-containing protein n=1 Tax=Desmophyllum pertusum TaxID=174260 RepID=A0A9X0CFG2_9CNID|nr:hypothetical protein OS493_023927 [Desmophyllum pertusum]
MPESECTQQFRKPVKESGKGGKLMKTSSSHLSNYPLLSLAICDFLTGAINIPYFIVFSFDVVPPAMYKTFAYWMYTLHSLLAVSGSYHILIITAEKYLAIIRPLRHHLVTKKTVFKFLAGIWITSAFVAVIPIVWNQSSSRLLWYIIHAAFCLVFVFFVPYAFIIYAFTTMFRAITKRQRPPSVHGDTSTLQVNDRKCILVFAIMAAIFLFCWLPYFTIMLVIYVNQYQNSDISSIIKAAEAFAIVRYMTSIINPLLYTFFKRDFWLALRNLPLKRGSTSFALENISTRRRPSSVLFYLTSRLRSISDVSSRRLMPSGNEGRLSMDCDRAEAHSGESINYITCV